MDRIDIAIFRSGLAGPCLSARVRAFARAGGHGHACPRCQGIGSVRASGQPGWVRVPCPACGGSGLLRPTR
jgi:DnaJ-class molecular chaperone